MERRVTVDKLYVPEERNAASRHILICISGFLSENDSGNTSWENLINECRDKKLPLYNVKWESKSGSEIGSSVAKHASNHLAPVANSVKQTSDLFSMQNLSRMASFIKDTASEGT